MNQKIYINDWLLLKPYEKQKITDSYYLKLSNDVKHAIVTSKHSIVLQKYLEDEEISHLACFLTSYFEDIISETNIWSSFIRIHKRLYKKQLPFYILDEYIEDEINSQDVSFLIWYFLNTIQGEIFIAPFHDFIIETADKVADVLLEAWEYAPENESLKSYYQVDKTADDFYIARNLIATVLFKTYLFNTDTLLGLKQKEFQIREEERDEETLMMFLNDNRDNTIQTSCTRLLSLTGKEWVSEILGSHHPLSSEYLKMSQKINAYFLYKGQDKNDIFLEHIASAKKFKLTKKSYDYSDKLKEIDTIVFMGIVRWKDEWWFSGIQFQHPFDPDLILDEKNSLESRKVVNFLDHQTTDVNKALKMQLKAFKDFNHGLQIAFIPSERIDEFIRAYIEFYRNSLNLSDQEINDAIERSHKEGYFGKENEPVNFNEVSDTGLVFFNPKSGCEIAMGVNSAFPLPNNPFLDKALSEEHVMQLFMDESISPELAMYCIDNCRTKLSVFKTTIGKKYADNIDFLLRFWKKDNYHTKPAITFTGKEEK
ncbi:MAG: DUF3843 family protein [Bacteroidales bacterium]|nr:DUF3843 family protein [Bacteroidales bacterium]